MLLHVRFIPERGAGGGAFMGNPACITRPAELYLVMQHGCFYMHSGYIRRGIFRRQLSESIFQKNGFGNLLQIHIL